MVDLPIPNGYYIKARCIQKSEISMAPPHIREIWDWLLMNANHKDGVSSGRSIKRGQLVLTYADIREGLAWYVGYRKERYNENHVKSGMKWLRDRRMITTTKTTRGVVITICNYSVYQNPSNYEKTNEATTEITNAQPMKNQGSPTINKNERMEKCKKEKRTRSNPTGFERSLSSKFLQIWKRFPVRVGKKQADRHFRASVKTEQDWININRALDKYLNSERVKKGIIQNGSTWFNNWQDWLEYSENVDRPLSDFKKFCDERGVSC